MSILSIALGFIPRVWQLDVLASLLRFSVLIVHRRAGKTVLAIMKLVDAALKCNQPLGHYGYLVPELKQAKSVVWDVLKSFVTKIPGVEINESELWVRFPHNRAKIRLFGADNMDALRGLYFDGLVVDEVAQMNRKVWGLILLPALTDRHKLDPSLGWALFIGTPEGVNLLSELYYRAVAGAQEWFGKLYTVYDTGVFTPEEIESIKRETPSESEFRQEWLCDFQASNDNALISLEDARKASKVVLREEEISFAARILGVDVAWSGGDRSVISRRQGLQLWAPKIRQGIPEKSFAGLVMQEADDFKANKIFIDVTGGYGGEVLSRLTENGYPAEGVKFSAKPISSRFLNLRAEMWWKAAEWVKGGASIPASEPLIMELCAPTYSMDNASNKIKVESKDDIKGRIGVSPDLADSVVLTHAYPVAQPGLHRVSSKVRSEFDPYDEERE